MGDIPNASPDQSLIDSGKAAVDTVKDGTKWGNYLSAEKAFAQALRV